MRSEHIAARGSGLRGSFLLLRRGSQMQSGGDPALRLGTDLLEREVVDVLEQLLATPFLVDVHQLALDLGPVPGLVHTPCCSFILRRGVRGQPTFILRASSQPPSTRPYSHSHSSDIISHNIRVLFDPSGPRSDLNRTWQILLDSGSNPVEA